LRDDHELGIARQRLRDGIGVIARSCILIVQRERWGEPLVTETA